MNTNQNVALSEESEQIRSWHKRSYENLKSLEGDPMTPTDHPLTEDRAAELWDAYREPGVLPLHAQGRIYGLIQIAMLRAAYDAGSAEWKANAEAVVERAERAEDRLADSVHVDEAARRVEAAREQGWDDAADWSIHNINDIDAERIRAANPHRPAPTLPTEDGAVIVPADGREYIGTNEGIANALVHLGGKWYGGAFQIKPEQITPGTWKVARND